MVNPLNMFDVSNKYPKVAPLKNAKMNDTQRKDCNELCKCQHNKVDLHHSPSIEQKNTEKSGLISKSKGIAENIFQYSKKVIANTAQNAAKKINYAVFQTEVKESGKIRSIRESLKKFYNEQTAYETIFKYTSNYAVQYINQNVDKWDIDDNLKKLIKHVTDETNKTIVKSFIQSILFVAFDNFTQQFKEMGFEDIGEMLKESLETTSNSITNPYLAVTNNVDISQEMTSAINSILNLALPRGEEHLREIEINNVVSIIKTGAKLAKYVFTYDDPHQKLFDLVQKIVLPNIIKAAFEKLTEPTTIYLIINSTLDALQSSEDTKKQKKQKIYLEKHYPTGNLIIGILKNLYPSLKYLINKIEYWLHYNFARCISSALNPKVNESVNKLLPKKLLISALKEILEKGFDKNGNLKNSPYNKQQKEEVKKTAVFAIAKFMETSFISCIAYYPKKVLTNLDNWCDKQENILSGSLFKHIKEIKTDLINNLVVPIIEAIGHFLSIFILTAKIPGFQYLGRRTRVKEWNNKAETILNAIVEGNIGKKCILTLISQCVQIISKKSSNDPNKFAKIEKPKQPDPIKQETSCPKNNEENIPTKEANTASNKQKSATSLFAATALAATGIAALSIAFPPAAVVVGASLFYNAQNLNTENMSEQEKTHEEKP